MAEQQPRNLVSSACRTAWARQCFDDGHIMIVSGDGSRFCQICHKIILKRNPRLERTLHK